MSGAGLALYPKKINKYLLTPPFPGEALRRGIPVIFLCAALPSGCV
jgi:hypothetical protein